MSNSPTSQFQTSSTIQTATQRLQTVTSHLASNPTTTMSAPTKDPITCHVLDTTTGRPGANITVSLSPLAQPTTIFHSTTNTDGRVTNWKSTLPSSSEPVTQQLQNLIQSLGTGQLGVKEDAEGVKDVVPAGSSLWKLSFATGEYYGVEKTFFPVVELTFLVKEGEHFHVPLLLGPYSYTTYRGS